MHLQTMILPCCSRVSLPSGLHSSRDALEKGLLLKLRTQNGSMSLSKHNIAHEIIDHVLFFTML